MLILLGNDISENPGPFDNEISIFHLNIRSIRHELDYVEANDNYDKKKLQSRSCIALIHYPLSINIIPLYTEIGSRVEGFSFAYRQIYIILIINIVDVNIIGK
jgi:hypothetical protein